MPCALPVAMALLGLPFGSIEVKDMFVTADRIVKPIKVFMGLGQC